MLTYSVIIPCYNCSNTIKDCLESVINQSITPDVIFLVNDCSTDSTSIVLCDLALIYKQCVVLNNISNRGPAFSRNRALSMVTTDLVAFLDSDDIWHPDKMSIALDVFQNDSNAFLLCHSVSSKRLFPVSTNERQVVIKYNYLLFSNIVCTSSVVMRRATKVNFNEQLRYCEDFELWLRILRSDLKCIFLSRSLVFRSGNGLSGNLSRMHSGVIEVLKKQLLYSSTFHKYIVFLSIFFEYFKYLFRIFKFRIGRK